jgi:hypothetical protein
VSIMHHAQLLYPPLGKIIKCSPWADWNHPLPSKTENMNRNWNLTPTVEVGLEHWTCPRERGWGKEPNSQHQNLMVLMQIKQQRLRRSGADWQANLPEELQALHRDREKHKGWERGFSHHPKQGRWWIPELISGTKGSIQKWIVPLSGGRADQTELMLKGNTAAVCWKE